MIESHYEKQNLPRLMVRKDEKHIIVWNLDTSEWDTFTKAPAIPSTVSNTPEGK